MFHTQLPRVGEGLVGLHVRLRIKVERSLMSICRGIKRGLVDTPLHLRWLDGHPSSILRDDCVVNITETRSIRERWLANNCRIVTRLVLQVYHTIEAKKRDNQQPTKKSNQDTSLTIMLLTFDPSLLPRTRTSTHQRNSPPPFVHKPKTRIAYS